MISDRMPEWLAGLTRQDFLIDGQGSPPAEIWERLDWANAFIDLGPSPAGNLGPYWHVPLIGAETIHRLYPKILKTKWANLIRQAISEKSNG